MHADMIFCLQTPSQNEVVGGQWGQQTEKGRSALLELDCSPLAGKRTGILDTCLGCLVVSSLAARFFMWPPGGVLKVLFKACTRKLHEETRERGNKGAD